MPENDSMMVVQLHAAGMRCHSCEEKLTAWLRDIDGVKSVQATYATGLVNITADEGASVDEMLKAVVAAGFIPGAPQVIGDSRGIPAVELPIEALKADIAEPEPEPAPSRAAEAARGPAPARAPEPEPAHAPSPTRASSVLAAVEARLAAKASVAQTQAGSDRLAPSRQPLFATAACDFVLAACTAHRARSSSPWKHSRSPASCSPKATQRLTCSRSISTAKCPFSSSRLLSRPQDSRRATRSS